MCSKEDLWAAVAENEAKIPLEMGSAQGGRVRTESLGKRPDGMVLDKEERVCYVLEFKRAFERYRGVHRNKRR